jgi:iron(III) transport system ATP-binding protein
VAISDSVIVMNAGRIEQIGTPEDIYRHPRTLFVADFVGNANVIRGQARGAAEGGEVNFVTVGRPVLRAAAGHAQAKGDAAALQAAYVDIFAPGRTDVPNATPGTIHRRMFHGDFIQYVVDWRCGQLLVRRPPTDLFAEGSAVTVSFAPEHCVVL